MLAVAHGDVVLVNAVGDTDVKTVVVILGVVELDGDCQAAAYVPRVRAGQLACLSMRQASRRVATRAAGELPRGNRGQLDVAEQAAAAHQRATNGCLLGGDPRHTGARPPPRTEIAPEAPMPSTSGRHGATARGSYYCRLVMQAICFT